VTHAGRKELGDPTHILRSTEQRPDVDGRDKPGHDGTR
jgi:hypothetical protein